RDIMKRLVVALLILAGSIVMFGRFFKFHGFSGLAYHRSVSQDTINRSFQVNPGGALKVHVGEGSLQLQAADIGRVDIEVVRRIESEDRESSEQLLKRYNIDFSQNGNDVVIHSESPRMRRTHNRIQYKVVVPRSYNVDLKTSGGSIDVSGIS